MNSKSIFGITVIVVGLVLLGFAQHASEAPADQISDMMTGRYSDTTVTYFVIGIAAIVFGGLSIAFGRRA
jgi:hypothetical protein